MDFWNLTLHFPSFTPTFDLSTIRFLGLPWALLSLLLFWAFFWIWRNLVLKARSSRSFRVWIAPLKQFGDLSEIWRRISMRCSYSNDIVVNKFSNRHLEHSTLGYSFNSRLLKWFFLKKLYEIQYILSRMWFDPQHSSGARLIVGFVTVALSFRDKVINEIYRDGCKCKMGYSISLFNEK